MNTKQTFETFRKTLYEIKLSRVLQHFTSEVPVGIMTTVRQERAEAQNTANNKAMAAFFRKKGYGFVWVDGAWIENQGTSDEVESIEVSLLIIGKGKDDTELFELMKSQAKKYKQEGFVYKGSDKITKVYDDKGKSFVTFSSFKPDKIAQAYSKIRSGSHRGRTFIFKEFRSPIGWIERLGIDKETLDSNCL